MLIQSYWSNRCSRIPTDKHYKVAPGGTVLLVNSAVDHSLNSPMEHSLLKADFEAKDVKGKMLNNPEVPALQNVFNIYRAFHT